MNTFYLVWYVVIERKSSAKCRRTACNSRCLSQRMQSKPNRAETRICFMVAHFQFRTFPKIRTSLCNFFQFSVKWCKKSCSPRFYWLSLYTKALWTNKLWISYPTYRQIFYSRLTIIKMLLTSENFQDFLRYLVESSIHCFSIHW